MNRVWTGALSLGILIGCAESPPTDLGAVLDEVRGELGAPGAILAVRYPDGTIERFASGVADLDTDRAVAVGDAYQAGSISKTLTAAVVLRLAEDGRLTLDDPLSRFLPDFPRGDEIRLHHLLQQTSGLKDFYLYLYSRPDRDEMIDAVTRDYSQAELIGLAARFGHHFDPGTDWDYSNANYFLLGVVIERATGGTLVEAYRDYLFEPLGMASSWIGEHEPPRAEMPLTGHLGPVAGWVHGDMFGELGPTTVLERSSIEWGAGGVVATADDLLTFLSALLDGELLRAGSLERMLQAVDAASLGATGDADAVPADVENRYAHGLIMTRRPGYEILGHGGIFAGHTAGLWRFPSCRVDVAIYFNRGFVAQRRLLDRLAPALGAHPSVTHSCVDSPEPEESR